MPRKQNPVSSAGKCDNDTCTCKGLVKAKPASKPGLQKLRSQQHNKHGRKGALSICIGPPAESGEKCVARGLCCPLCFVSDVTLFQSPPHERSPLLLYVQYPSG